MRRHAHVCTCSLPQLYKTYVRTSTDSVVPGSPTSTMAPVDGCSSHTSSASDETATPGLAVSRASSYGGSESDVLKAASAHLGGLYGGSEARAVPQGEAMDVDEPHLRPASPTSTLSGSSSRADSEVRAPAADGMHPPSALALLDLTC